MSDSENEGEMKRLTNVDELKEILASFDAADRKTSARGVKESLRAARAVIEQILARPWEEPDEDDDVTVDNEDAIPQHAIENREFCEQKWDDLGFDNLKNAFNLQDAGKLTGKSDWIAWWQKIVEILVVHRRYFMWFCPCGGYFGWLDALDARNAGKIVQHSTKEWHEKSLAYHSQKQKRTEQLMYAKLRCAIGDNLLKSFPAGRAIKSPAVFIAKVLSRFTEQGPQRHFALIKKEIGLDYIKYINANDGCGVSDFVTCVNALHADIEDPIGKDGDVDVRSDKSKKLGFLSAFRDSTHNSLAVSYMVNDMSFAEVCTRMCEIDCLQNGELGTKATVSGMSTEAKKACFAWEQQGKCRFGNNCKYMHDPAKKGQSPKNGQNAGQKECRYHARQPGSCKFGNKCRFEHSNRGKHENAVKFVASKGFKRTVRLAVNQVLKKQKKASRSSNGGDGSDDGFQIVSGVTVQLKNDMRKGFLSKHGVASIARTDSFLVNVDSGAACGVANDMSQGYDWVNCNDKLVMADTKATVCVKRKGKANWLGIVMDPVYLCEDFEVCFMSVRCATKQNDGLMIGFRDDNVLLMNSGTFVVEKTLKSRQIDSL